MLEKAILIALVGGAVLIGLEAIDLPAVFQQLVPVIEALDSCAKAGWGDLTCRAD